MPKHLVLVGGGHAHLTLLVHCRRFVDLGLRVTVISASQFHYYSGMGPGALAGTYRPQDIRFHVKKTVVDRGGTFLEDHVTKMDPVEHTLFLRSGGTVTYDAVSFNTGSDVVLPPGFADRQNVFPVKPIVSLLAARKAILEGLKRGPVAIAVLGGGPAGVEVAGNAWRLANDRAGVANISIIPGRELLADHPRRLRTLARRSLLRRGIAIHDGTRADGIEEGSVLLSSGERLRADIVIAATGIRPASLFSDSGLPVGPEGGLLVNRFLQSTAHPEMLGGGDAVCFEPRPLAKVGVYAVRQNAVLERNVLAALGLGSPVPFKPQRKFMLIFNMGDGTGILARDRFAFESRLAWRLKDRIDRSFMRRYQVSGERDDRFDDEEAGHEHA